MYNEGQKTAFIAASYPDEARHGEIAGVFELFAPFEESWSLDLVKQQLLKLQPAFDEVAETLSTSKAKAVLTILRKYRSWYLSSNPNAVSAGVGLLKLNVADKLRGKLYASPGHLQRAMDEVFEPVEKETMDCVYRALLWLAFTGVPRDRAILITIDEVDFYWMKIHHDGKDYVIPTEGLPAFHVLCERDSLVYIHSKPDYEQRRPRCEGNQLLRGFTEYRLQITKLLELLRRRYTDTPWSFVYNDVFSSGLYYRKFDLERMGEKDLFSEDIAQRVAELEQSKEADTKNAGSTYYSIRDRYMQGYNQWKALFPVEAEQD